MGSFSLNNFTPSEGNFVSKILLPGTHKCRIIDLKLERPPYDRDQYNLIFRLIRIDEKPFQSYPEDNRDDRICVEIEKSEIVKAIIQ